MGKSLRTGISAQFQRISPRYLVITKRKMVTLQVEKFDRHHVHQMRINIISNRIYWRPVLNISSWMQDSTLHSTLLLEYFCPKCKTSINQENIKPKMRDILQNKWPHTHHKSEGHERREKTITDQIRLGRHNN